LHTIPLDARRLALATAPWRPLEHPARAWERVSEPLRDVGSAPSRRNSVICVACRPRRRGAAGRSRRRLVERRARRRRGRTRKLP